jgi:hypothetical protein
MQFPEKPTSGSWAVDARALLEMGAKLIDAATVSGVLEEHEALVARIRELAAKCEATRPPFGVPLPTSYDQYWVKSVDPDDIVLVLRHLAPELVGE